MDVIKNGWRITPHSVERVRDGKTLWTAPRWSKLESLLVFVGVMRAETRCGSWAR